MFDTIVAPITGIQPAAVAIVRVSGPESWQIAGRLLPSFPADPEPRRAIYGTLSTRDDGLVLPFAEGASYTGEQSVEFNIHGSIASIRALIEAALAAGARMARPGEFTERAFLNGRIDLSQAEGVRDSIEAATDAQLRQASMIREGELAKKVHVIAHNLTSVLATVEASVDFSEEIGDLDTAAASLQLSQALSDLEALLSTAHAGQCLRKGARVAIVGRPNAGKSSLLNALIGRDRAIVTEIAGTTRDYVEETVELGGVLVTLVDTAGIRETDDRIESEGVARAKRQSEIADVVWYVHDSSDPWSTDRKQEFESINRPKLLITNKSDLGPASIPRAVTVSATAGSGLNTLVEWLKEFTEIERAFREPLIHPRHEPIVRTARELVVECLADLEHDMPYDLHAVKLRAALDELGKVTGETASADMLERIFRDFCIGK